MQAQLRACVFAVVDGREGTRYATGAVVFLKAAASDLCLTGQDLK